MSRVSWLQHHMQSAEHTAQMSTCAAGRKVGCVFVKDNRVISSGVNGVPAGYPHPLVCVRQQEGCKSGEGLHLCACAHAEANGIANAARVGVCLHGSTLYVTSQPCAACAGLLANVGVKEIVYRDPYPHKLSQLITGYAQIPTLKYIEVNETGMLDLEKHE